jgi:hypothetical protein
MVQQNFAATAIYFERRAGKVPAGDRRRQLENTAAHYRAKAQACGNQPAPQAGSEETRVIPPRRQKLVELFRAYNSGGEPP